jgi:glycosyltransferase involved in cell wall biosynthesis
MKIAILSTSKNAIGGVEVFCHTLKGVLESYGHNVTIVGYEDVGNEKLLKFSKKIGLYVPVLGYLVGHFAGKQEWDLIITNGFLGWNLKNKNIVNIQHGTFKGAAIRIDKNKNFFKFIMKYYVWGYFEGLCARRATKTFAVSDETKYFVEKLYGAKNVEVIPNIVDTDIFTIQSRPERVEKRQKYNISPDDKIIIFVGRYEYAKGANIMNKLIKNFDDKTALLIVDGEASLNYKNKKIVLKEVVCHDEVNEFYAIADVFLLPSHHEGSAFVLLEAMSTGLPFIISNVGLAGNLLKEPDFAKSVVNDFKVSGYMGAINYFFEIGEGKRYEYGLKARNYILKNHSLATAGNLYKIIVQ